MSFDARLASYAKDRKGKFEHVARESNIALLISRAGSSAVISCSLGVKYWRVGYDRLGAVRPRLCMESTGQGNEIGRRRKCHFNWSVIGSPLWPRHGTALSSRRCAARCVTSRRAILDDRTLANCPGSRHHSLKLVATDSPPAAAPIPSLPSRPIPPDRSVSTRACNTDQRMAISLFLHT